MERVEFKDVGIKTLRGVVQSNNLGWTRLVDMPCMMVNKDYRKSGA